MIRHARMLAAVLTTVLATVAGNSAALTLLTEENPPLNFTQDGKAAGPSTLVVQEVARRAGHPADVKVVPWSDGYSQVQSNPDVCLFSMARTPERFKLFQWVGPINRGVYSLFGRAAFAGEVKRVDDLKPYRIGVVNDARATYLRQRGFDKLVALDRDEDILPMLVADPKQDGVDLWMTQNAGAADKARKAGINDLKLVFSGIMSQDYWLACNAQMPRETVKALQGALQEMRQDGALQKLTTPPAVR
jgi:polar amino acid transport system substrate-binding protein